MELVTERLRFVGYGEGASLSFPRAQRGGVALDGGVLEPAYGRYSIRSHRCSFCRRSYSLQPRPSSCALWRGQIRAGHWTMFRSGSSRSCFFNAFSQIAITIHSGEAAPGVYPRCSSTYPLRLCCFARFREGFVTARRAAYAAVRGLVCTTGGASFARLRLPRRAAVGILTGDEERMMEKNVKQTKRGEGARGGAERVRRTRFRRRARRSHPRRPRRSSKAMIYLSFQSTEALYERILSDLGA